jgi:EmrB/QacA subfamily drug resistance transporter
MSAAVQARPADAPGLAARRWGALAVVSLAQLVIALDATIVNIALPAAQGMLALSDADRQWVITAYGLAFGGLVLLGGRIADMAGRRRTFLVGLLGFAAASALGGAATSLGMLVGARALQGAFGALLAPTALSLLAVTFVDARERARAFAVYGAIAGSGAAVGLLLGGALTQYLGWRWCLYVNVPIALVAAAGGRLVLPEPRSAGEQRLDLLGAALAGGGLVALVSACSRAVTSGWTAGLVLGLLAASAALLGSFVLLESRIAHPLLPLRLLADRDRAGACLSVALAVAGLLGLFLFLTYDLQVVLRWSPVAAGLGFLPLSASVMLSSQVLAGRLLPRVPPRALVVPGLLVGAAAMLLLSRTTADASYVSRALPAEVLLGLGMGCVFVPAFGLATRGVPPGEAGVAAALVTAAQQVGGSVGTALLNTIAAGATAADLAAQGPGAGSEALVQGFSAAAVWGAGILTVAAALASILVRARRAAPPDRQGGSS